MPDNSIRHFSATATNASQSESDCPKSLIATAAGGKVDPTLRSKPKAKKHRH